MTEPLPNAQAFADIFAAHSVEGLIRNLQTKVTLAQFGDQLLPVTVNDGGQPGNCYLCNPVTGYTDYAIEETRNFAAMPALRGALVGLVHGVAPLVRATGLDRAVHVNNWLFSTNPAPAVDRSMAADLRDKLCAAYPTHAIVLRSLNTFSDAAAMTALVAEGFTLLPSRQIYLFDGRNPRPFSKDMKNDRALLRRTGLREMRNDAVLAQDYARIETLYNQLYLEKYTPLNPQYTAAYIARMHQRGLLHLEGLRAADGELVAIGGRFQYGQTLTQPLLGYDTTRPQTEGLYRLITAMAQRDAVDNGLLFNMSAGAASFKRHRNAVAAIEYSAVFCAHLPRRQRWATKAIGGVLRGVGVPLMRKYEL